MSKRIWSESLLEWDKAGAELWNLVAGTGRRPGADGDGDADWQDFDEEHLKSLQPTITIMEWSPNLSEAKKRLLEIAGIPRNFSNRKQIREDVSIFITEVKFRNK